MAGPCELCCFPAVESYGREVIDSGDTPLLVAAYFGHETCTKVWLEAGADVNAANEQGGTPLSHSAWRGHKGCLKLLLEAGADVNISDQDGDPPLSIAALDGHDDCVDLLSQAGADAVSYTHLTLPTKRIV